MMTDWNRMNKISILLMFMMKIKQLFIPLFVSLFAGGINEITGWIFPVFIVVLLVYCFFYWFYFKYQLENNELRIEKGIFIKKRRYIQKNRVQSVAVHSPLLHRMFNVVKIKIETAGGGMEAEVELIAIPEKQINDIRQSLGKQEEREQMEVNQRERNSDSQDEARVADNDGTIIEDVPMKTIILSGVTSGKVGLVFSAAAAVFSQIDQLLPAGFYEKSYGALLSMGTFLLIGAFLMLALIAWGISVLLTVIQYGNFKVIKSGNKIIISRGLLEKRELTLQLDRVTGVRYVSNPIRQWFGYWSIYVDSAGGGIEEEQFSTVLLPLGDKNRVQRLAEQILPETNFQTEINSLPRRVALRYMLRASFVWWILFFAIVVWVPRGWLFILVPILFTYIGWQRYKDAGIFLSSEYLVIQARNFNLARNILPRMKIHSLTYQQSYFQKHRQLYSLSANILSTTGGRTYRLKDIETGVYPNLFNWYAKRNNKKRQVF